MPEGSQRRVRLIALALVPVAPAGIPVLAAGAAAFAGLTRAARADAAERLG